MRCPNCGTTLRENAKFCSRCGQQVEIKKHNHQPSRSTSNSPSRKSNHQGKYAAAQSTRKRKNRKSNSGVGLIIVLVVLIIVLACVILFVIRPMLSDTFSRSNKNDFNSWAQSQSVNEHNTENKSNGFWGIGDSPSNAHNNEVQQDAAYQYHKLSNFSEGLCWIRMTHSNGSQKDVIYDRNGTIVAEFESGQFKEFGDFHNSVSLVKTPDNIYHYIDTKGNLIFSSDDPEYADLIQGVFDDGYMFLRKTESSLTSSVRYYAVMNCYKEFVIDWTEYGDYDLFDYLGGGVFAFLDEYRNNSSVSARFYNSETNIWLDISEYGEYWRGISSNTLLMQPHLVAGQTNGWVMVENGGSPIALSTKNGTAYDICAEADYEMSGLYGDGVYVLLETDYNDNVSGMAYFDTNTGNIKTIDYEHVELITPQTFYTTNRHSTAVEIGRWPAFNMPQYTNDMYENHRTYTHLCTLQFSEGAMLMQLKGKDGLNYYTLIDKQGNNIVEPTPGEAVATLGCGYFTVMHDGIFCVLNQYGDIVFENLTDGNATYGTVNSIDAFHDGIAYAYTTSGTGLFIDTDGNVILEVNG